MSFERMTEPEDRGPMWLLGLLTLAIGFMLFAILFTVSAALSQEIGHADDDREGVNSYRPAAAVKRAKTRGKYRQLAEFKVIGGRPPGCPHRFCGCALAIKRFGKIVPELNLAWNWRRFPRTSPRIGAVAVRRGHVMEIIGGSPGNWVVYDPNSGGGKIRIRQRSLAGYFTVDPTASRHAMGAQ